MALAVSKDVSCWPKITSVGRAIKSHRQEGEYLSLEHQISVGDKSTT